MTVANLRDLADGVPAAAEAGAVDLEGDPPLKRFEVSLDPASGAVRVDAEQIEAWQAANPDAFHREESLGG